MTEADIIYNVLNHLQELQLDQLERYEWYVGDISVRRAEWVLKQFNKEGGFIVRGSTHTGLYTLSLFTKEPYSCVRHYRIKRNSRVDYYVKRDQSFSTIEKLIEYYSQHTGGLITKLRCSPGKLSVRGHAHDDWEIDPADLTLLEKLGEGSFGVVRRAKYRGCLDTAVKMIKQGAMSENEFIKEAKVMSKLEHKNLVQLYGVCREHRPIFIVTEYMKHGSLLNYLKKYKHELRRDEEILVDMCIQVCKGMAYLEKKNYVHRDLAARNCLVGSEKVVKVADFGLTRYVSGDHYSSSRGIFAIRWAPPEVFRYARYSSKSDVWSYGVLMWEVFSCGKTPYGDIDNDQVQKDVKKGYILEQPRSCPDKLYKVMKACWSRYPEDRPSFRTLKRKLDY